LSKNKILSALCFAFIAAAFTAFMPILFLPAESIENETIESISGSEIVIEAESENDSDIESEQKTEVDPEGDHFDLFEKESEPVLKFNNSVSDVVSSFRSLGPINSILVSQHGEIVAEQYFRRMSTNRANNIKSASKSVLSILVGIAIEEGYLESVHQPIGEFFPDYFQANPDSVKEAITIEDLLTMRSGLASTSRAHYGRWVTSPNWIEYALDRPITGVAGVDRTYSTGNTHLLSVIITRASGMSTFEFGNKYLFHPMNIQIAGWDRDPQGYYLGGNNMAMRSRDMVKIGQLMMDMGVYNGERLVPARWIVDSVKPVTGRNPGWENYGYLWFRRYSDDIEMVYAFGNGGQYIMILPALEAIITVTTQNESGLSTRNYRRELFRQIDREVVPRLKSSYTPA